MAVTEKEFDKEIIRRAMSILGSRTSERKKASSRANGQKSRGRPRGKPSKISGAEMTDKAT